MEVNSQNPGDVSPVTTSEARSPFLKSRKFLLISGAVALIVILGFSIAVVSGKWPPREEKSTPKTPSLAGGQALSQQQKELLGGYFSKVSPANFKEDILAQIPAGAANAYGKYLGAETADQKLEAAMTFFIYLNNQAMDTSNPKVAAFLDDVRADLESNVGQRIY